jgi:phenylacetate-CoA ligase
MDVMTVRIETPAEDGARYQTGVVEALKMKAVIELVPVGSLPNDGKVIEDLRKYD